MRSVRYPWVSFAASHVGIPAHVFARCGRFGNRAPGEQKLQTLASSLVPSIRSVGQSPVAPILDGRWRVGMDLSIHSPAVVCHRYTRGANANTWEIHLIYYAQTKEQESRPVASADSVEWATGMESCPIIRLVYHRLIHQQDSTLPNKAMIDSQYYWKTARQLIDCFAKIVPETSQPMPYVFIEDYTFHNANSRAGTGIGAITGIARGFLGDRGYVFQPINTKTAKKEYGGRGDADKRQMWRACSNKHPFLIHFLQHHFQYNEDRVWTQYNERYKMQCQTWSARFDFKKSDYIQKLADDPSRWSSICLTCDDRSYPGDQVDTVDTDDTNFISRYRFTREELLCGDKSIWIQLEYPHDDRYVNLNDTNHPCVLELLQIHPKPKWNPPNIPCPLQDLVDAWSLSHSRFNSDCQPTPKRSNKSNSQGKRKKRGFLSMMYTAKQPQKRSKRETNME